MLLTGCRCNEWASARTSWIDMNEGLMVIPATAYKTNHIHVVPLVPAAFEILRAIPTPQKGDYLLSSTQGLVPMQGVSKYFNTRLPDAILALTGTKFPRNSRLTICVEPLRHGWPKAWAMRAISSSGECSGIRMAA